MDLVRDCIAHMRAQGIDQWDEVYPDPATLARDIDEGSMSVAIGADGIVGMIVLDDRLDPGWAPVAWTLTGRPGAVHRLMVAPRWEGRGLAAALLRSVEDSARSRGFACLRLDVFRGNPRAVRLYELAGYRHAGECRFRKGWFACMEKRVAIAD